MTDFIVLMLTMEKPYTITLIFKDTLWDLSNTIIIQDIPYLYSIAIVSYNLYKSHNQSYTTIV
jgi:hypothetical protein